MNFTFHKLVILLFLIIFSLSGSFSNEIALASSASQDSTSQTSQEPIILGLTRIFKQTYRNASIIITGTVFDYYELNFIDCSILFVDNNSVYDIPNILVDTLSTLTIINSTISYHSNNNKTKDYSLFRGNYNASIVIKNSYIDSSFTGPAIFNMTRSKELIISNTVFNNFSNLFFFSRTYFITLTSCTFINPNPKFIQQTNNENRNSSNYLIATLNSTAVNLIDNNFENIPNILYYDSNNYLNLTLNNFTTVQNVVYYQHSIKSFVRYNSFINVTNPFFISSEASFGSLNSTINNYIQIPNIIKFDNGFYNISSVQFNFENNYYSDFSSLYLTAFGYYEEPYHNKYFIDLFPLSKPIQDYSTSFNVLFLKTNSNYNQNLGEPSISLFNYHWLIFILFYGTILLIPVLVISIPKLSKLKKCAKRKNLKKMLESID